MSAGDLQRLLLALERPLRPGSTGTPAFFIARRARALSPIRRITCGLGPDELDVAGLADLGEVRALGQEPVARVDRVGAGDLRRADDRRHVEVALGRPRRPDADVLVGEPDVQRVLVGLRVDGHGLDAHLPARQDDAQRDLAAVRDQDLLEHHVTLMANRRSPYWTGWPFST